MAVAAPKLRGAARTTNRSASLRKAQRKSARERAEEAWGEAPEVYGGDEDEESSRDNAIHAAGSPSKTGEEAVSGAGYAAGAMERGAVDGGASTNRGNGPDKEQGRKDARDREKKSAGSGKHPTQSAQRVFGPEYADRSQRTTQAELNTLGSRQGRLRAAQRKTQKGTRLEQSMERMRAAEKAMNKAYGSQRNAERQKKSAKGLIGRLSVRRGLKRQRKEAKRAKKAYKKARKDFMKKFVGIMLIRSFWAGMPLSFGHTIYLIDLTYLLGFMQKWIGFYLPIDIPEVGEAESFESLVPGRKKQASGKAKRMLIKLWILIVIGWNTFWVLLIDILILMIVAMIIIMGAYLAHELF